MKRFTETKRRTGRQPGTKSASRPAYKPLINRWSTADLVPPSVYIHRISLVRASGETLKRRVFDALESTMDLCFPGE